MALMLSSLYDALLEAGASEEKARKAAEEAAQHEARFTALGGHLTSLDSRISLLQWTVGIGFSVMVALHLVTLNWLWQVLQRLPAKP
jgi:hypothetical protein